MPMNFKPSEGEIWHHPLSLTRWYIHSITDDGWVRYRAEESRRHAYNYPLYTRPVLDFVKLYVRAADSEVTTMPATNIVPDGTPVRYHGSLTGYHGPMTVEASHDEYVPTHGEYSPVRYVLRYGPRMYDRLHNVRPESFTPVTADENGQA